MYLDQKVVETARELGLNLSKGLRERHRRSGQVIGWSLLQAINNSTFLGELVDQFALFDFLLYAEAML